MSYYRYKSQEEIQKEEMRFASKSGKNYIIRMPDVDFSYFSGSIEDLIEVLEQAKVGTFRSEIEIDATYGGELYGIELTRKIHRWRLATDEEIEVVKEREIKKKEKDKEAYAKKKAKDAETKAKKEEKEIKKAKELLKKKGIL